MNLEGVVAGGGIGREDKRNWSSDGTVELCG